LSVSNMIGTLVLFALSVRAMVALF
jgi:hypothetical protein